MASTAQDLYQQNVSNLLDQLINHHCALMRCAQFGGHLQLNPNDTVQLKITENGKNLIERQFDLSDRHVMERLRATIQSMQEILPAASALSPNGGAA
ncbi:hypothetical protein [Idiomarina xiamenensis]|uniref:Uncharacterized protein n=1 Tax=Idiomarina xiamenensis 10-D-4 TaxID=740709 RepID=K2JXR3_9GAMM|nr:hypothetical protein [Idiomarina xiamenensis]EKE79447.1 hypothetical protein A10D4_12804 [Idiomarina xiamenensis 10-D-4]